MPKICVELKTGKQSVSRACPIHVVTPENYKDRLKELARAQRNWLGIEGFTGGAGELALVQDTSGNLDCVLFGSKSCGGDEKSINLAIGKLATLLPEGLYHFASGINNETDAALAWLLSAYDFKRYSGSPTVWPRLAVGKKVDRKHLELVTTGVNLARDLINTPANDMGPQQLESAVRRLAKTHKANVSVVRGDNLPGKNFPLVHAVGRASDQPPRLIDMKWGSKTAPKVTLAGKGVCFDTGGLNIKPG
ncbi:MAG TPA: leucyl aminopeptidase family protein, partial [Rhizobiales bacterium]|nr:leucyl aminopeptidase family protein [Hyphomicrobiales bacterium]